MRRSNEWLCYIRESGQKHGCMKACPILWVLCMMLAVSQCMAFCHRYPDAVEEGRNCRKPCETGDECKGQKKCLCDDVCGMSCFNPESECGEPEQVENGHVRWNHVAWGGKALYSCNEGYIMNGTDERTCHSDRKWTGTPPICERGCTQPNDVEDSYPLDFSGGFRAGESHQFACRTGYYMTGNSMRTCTEDLAWSPVEFGCYLQRCDAIASVRHGTILYTNGLNFGSIATLHCDIGYERSSSQNMRCFSGRTDSSFGEWTGSLPTCTAVPCTKPLAPEDGSVDADAGPWEYGRRVTYDCNVGYKLHGNAYATCDENGSWGEAATCVVDPDCDFNHYASSTCGYDSVYRRWSRQLALEPRSIEGHVIRATTAGAKLVSPELPVEWADGSICLRFHYKLVEYYRGAGAKLKVESPSDPGHLYWESHADEESDVWLDAVITFELNYPVQYQFVDVRGTVMMDDIEVLNQECEQHCNIGTCQNGGTCVNRIAGYTCFCARYFKGGQCQTDERCDIPRFLIPNGRRVTFPSNLPGDKVDYTCNENHKFTGRRSIVKRVIVQCDWQGIGVGSRWHDDPNSLRCEEITCVQPLLGENQELLNQQSVWHVGNTARYACDPGYVFAYPSYTTRQCLEDGLWSTSDSLECIVPYCAYHLSGPHPAMPNPSKDRYGVGMTITFQCEIGYDLVGSPQLTCRGHKEWTAEQPTCKRVSCGAPPNVRNARNSQREYNYNEEHDYFECDQGYYLDGLSTITCQYDGTWTRGPTCREICDEVDAPEHGSVTNSSWRRRTFSCGKMYFMKGEKNLICRDNGTWSGDPPLCKEKKPAKSTVFEGIEYLVYTQSKLKSNFVSAQQMCSSIRGNLAVLYTDQVRETLQGILSKIRKNINVYVGIVRRKIPGDPHTKFFDWVIDGIPTVFPGTWNRTDRQVYWKRSDAKKDAGDCGVIFKKLNASVRKWKDSYRWKNLNCDRRRSFVCQRNYRACSRNPCKHGGVCEDMDEDEYTCRCPEGYYGKNCKREWTCAKPRTSNTYVAQVDGVPMSEVPAKFRRGQTITFTCTGQNIALVDPSFTLTCLSNGVWNKKTSDICGEIEIAQAIHSSPRENTQSNSATEIGMVNSFEKSPTPAVEAAGRSSQEFLEKRTKPCERPELPDRGYIDDDSDKFAAGTEVALKCEEGRVLHGGSSILTCLGTGEWSQNEARCKANSCTLYLDLIPGGLQIPGFTDAEGLMEKTYDVGADITLCCADAATLTPANEEAPVLRCQIGGIWSPNLYDFACDE